MCVKKIAVGVLVVLTIGTAGYGVYRILSSEPEAPDLSPPEIEKMTLQVYFGNTELNPGLEECGKVFPVQREVPETKGVARAALNELFEGPTEKEKEEGYTSFFSEETEGILRSVRVEEKTAYVDLEDIRPLIPNASSSCGSAQLLSEIKRTLTQFPTVERVVIAIKGEPRVFYEWIQIGCGEENDYCDAAPFVGQGVIEGSLGYPSEGIPEDMEVCAYNSEREVCTKERMEGGEYVYGVGYELEVPSGEYYLRSTRPQFEGYKGYYTEYVDCGMKEDCLSHQPVKVNVERGEKVEGADILDWRYFPDKIEAEKRESVRLDEPSPFQEVSLPFQVKGEARGSWFFEASFPVRLEDRTGDVLASTPAQAEGEWMTNDFVPFSTQLGDDLSVEEGAEFYSLVIEKDNPSGLPENADSFSIPIYIR